MSKFDETRERYIDYQAMRIKDLEAANKGIIADLKVLRDALYCDYQLATGGLRMLDTLIYKYELIYKYDVT